MMEHKGYGGKVEFDPDAGILHGEVVSIRNVVTFQGRSVREIEKAFKESVDDYLAFCASRGEEPNAPSSGQFVVRIAPELHRKANMAAKMLGKSLNAFVAEAVAREAGETLTGSGRPGGAARRRTRKAG